MRVTADVQAYAMCLPHVLMPHVLMRRQWLAVSGVHGQPLGESWASLLVSLLI
jgi:hypothetical protein